MSRDFDINMLYQSHSAYHAYEFMHAMLQPLHQVATFTHEALEHPANVLGEHRAASAYWKMVANMTRRYDKPGFGIDEVNIDSRTVAVEELVVVSRPFCNLLNFKRNISPARSDKDPKVLIVAPMSGHHATLLRDTVRAMLPEHDTYITDWQDARGIALSMGTFDLDDYIDYVRDFVRYLGGDLHVIAVCQPSVPVLAATALMAEDGESCVPASLTLMGGPIDTRRNPTAVNDHAAKHDLEWFKNNVISWVPFPNPGCMRAVYPGFLQLSGFMAMNLDRHVNAFKGYFEHLVEGDADSARQHEAFYDEYLAVMDLPADYFLQTVDRVFQRQALANREFMYRDRLVDCAAISSTTLMTVEGERDDICGLGQTEAAHDLCNNIPKKQHLHYVQQGAGHYGVFNGRRWRTEIQPRIAKMIRSCTGKSS